MDNTDMLVRGWRGALASDIAVESEAKQTFCRIIEHYLSTVERLGRVVADNFSVFLSGHVANAVENAASIISVSIWLGRLLCGNRSLSLAQVGEYRRSGKGIPPGEIGAGISDGKVVANGSNAPRFRASFATGRRFT